MTNQRRGGDPLTDLLRCAEGRLETAIDETDRREHGDLTFHLMAARMLIETARVRLALGSRRPCPVCGWEPLP